MCDPQGCLHHKILQWHLCIEHQLPELKLILDYLDKIRPKPTTNTIELNLELPIKQTQIPIVPQNFLEYVYRMSKIKCCI